MKLFIVWYIAGALNGAMGPVAMTFAECERYLPGLMDYLHDTTTPPPGITHADLVMRCEWHRRPPL